MPAKRDVELDRFNSHEMEWEARRIERASWRWRDPDQVFQSALEAWKRRVAIRVRRAGRDERRVDVESIRSCVRDRRLLFVDGHGRVRNRIGAFGVWPSDSVTPDVHGQCEIRDRPRIS